jgi:hypothetical protein
VAGGVDVLLDKADEGIEEIRDLYEQTLAAKAVSDELLYAVHRVVSTDLQPALDRTATAVANKFGTGTKRPYFPLVAEPSAFPAALEAQLKGLKAKHPAVADAFERHQPYQPGMAALGYLHALAKVNKHQDFTPQTRVAQRATRFEGPGGARIELGHGSPGTGGGEAGGPASITLGPGAEANLGGLSIREIEPVEVEYVDWLFADLGVSALGTLENLARLIGDAVTDIDREAGL